MTVKMIVSIIWNNTPPYLILEIINNNFHKIETIKSLQSALEQ